MNVQKDILNSENRRLGYAFTNCTNCGPRFSIIQELPYDRDKTTMSAFVMCEECHSEYSDQTDRRFHTQPNACAECGPMLWIEDNKGNRLELEDPISFVRDMLIEGKIFAIKGLEGFHIACDRQSETAVRQLRDRKKRSAKPLAIMTKDIDTVKKYCEVSPLEAKILTGIKKPILILKQKENCDLPQNIAPKQKTIGVMLPYTPITFYCFQKK